MNLGSLFSGGKDSVYAIHKAQKQGHQVKCLLSIFPKSEESHLLHHPNLQWTKLQSESMKLPQLTISSASNGTDDELAALETLLQNAKEQLQQQEKNLAEKSYKQKGATGFGVRLVLDYLINN